jgi:predicted amidohydrolase YtcJ
MQLLLLVCDTSIDHHQEVIVHILYNGWIRTLEPENPIAQALLIDHGEIKAIGKDQEILSLAPSSATRQNLNGKFILPGLIDAHIHLEHYALGLTKVDCETSTRAACVSRVAARAAQTLVGAWVLGHGWNQNQWVEGYGNRDDLDAITSGHPVYLTAKSLHAAWVNSVALKLAGIHASTPDPEGGKLGRDSQGQLTGILYETAMELVSQVIPKPTTYDIAKAIQKAIPLLVKMGLTGVHDFDRSQCFSALQMLHEAGALKLRIIKSIPIECLSEAVTVGLRTGFGDDYLRIGSIKAFADGALGPHTAAMLHPYEDDPDNVGMLMMDVEELVEHGCKAVGHGLSLAVHAIGDKANHQVLNAFEQIRLFEQGLDPGSFGKARHRIEHVQVLHPHDVHRLAALEIIASMQPIHATSDMDMADRYWGKRAALSYAWREQLNQRAVLAFGSDAPVESPNPFWGLHAAVTRRPQNGAPGEAGWYPEQRLQIMEAWQGFTTGPAYAAGMEYRQGRLAPGYLADLVLMDEDPFTCPVERLLELQPDGTMIGGEWVWQK